MRKNLFVLLIKIFFLYILPATATAQEGKVSRLPYSSVTAFYGAELLDSVKQSLLGQKLKVAVEQHIMALDTSLVRISDPPLSTIRSSSTQFFHKDQVATLSFRVCCEEPIHQLDTMEITQVISNRDKTLVTKSEYVGIYSNQKASIVALLDIFSWKEHSHKTYEFTVGQANLVTIRESYITE